MCMNTYIYVCISQLLKIMFSYLLHQKTKTPNVSKLNSIATKVSLEMAPEGVYKYISFFKKDNSLMLALTCVFKESPSKGQVMLYLQT